MEIQSPISKKFTVRVIESVTNKRILDLYKEDFDIDVTRFFNDVKEVLICKCLESGFLFYYPRKLSGDEKFYDELKRQMPSKYNLPYYPPEKWEYGICVDMVKPGDKVYEIGAGNGAFLEKLLKLGITEIYGTELNADSIQLAANRNIKLDYKTIEQKALEVSNEFDVVFTFQVLEHITDVKEFLDASIKIIKPNGKLVIAVPFNNPYLFKNDIFNTLNLPPHHMGLWNKKVFKNLHKYFPIQLEQLIVEPLPSEGYDFEQFYSINKNKLYPLRFPFKMMFDKYYYRWLKRHHKTREGKNIIAIFRKK